jgi:hypothetical protein
VGDHATAVSDGEVRDPQSLFGRVGGPGDDVHATYPADPDAGSGPVLDLIGCEAGPEGLAKSDRARLL